MFDLFLKMTDSEKDNVLKKFGSIVNLENFNELDEEEKEILFNILFKMCISHGISMLDNSFIESSFDLLISNVQKYLKKVN